MKSVEYEAEFDATLAAHIGTWIMENELSADKLNYVSVGKALEDFNKWLYDYTGIKYPLIYLVNDTRTLYIDFKDNVCRILNMDAKRIQNNTLDRKGEVFIKKDIELK